MNNYLSDSTAAETTIVPPINECLIALETIF
jgi:hypothetical protein